MAGEEYYYIRRRIYNPQNTVYSKKVFLQTIQKHFENKQKNQQEAWRIRDIWKYFPSIKQELIKVKVWRYHRLGLLERANGRKYRLARKGLEYIKSEPQYQN